MFRDSTTSFRNLLPHPKVQTQGDHAFVSLKECIIKDMMAHGYELDWIGPAKIPSVDSGVDSSSLELFQLLANTKQSARVYQGSVKASNGKAIPTWIMLWSDDFEPSLQAKQSRGSVWTLCAMIATPQSLINTDVNTCFWLSDPKSLITTSLKQRWHQR